LVCGPANYFLLNAHPLTAIIESDWTTMSFTMNWKNEWVARLTEFDLNWRRLFERTGIDAFEVAYEDLVESYESTVLTVLRYLELPVSAGQQVAPPRLQKQADLVTEEWVRRYQELKC
jgi:LPS sulfotransferase NodH